MKKGIYFEPYFQDVHEFLALIWACARLQGQKRSGHLTQDGIAKY